MLDRENIKDHVASLVLGGGGVVAAGGMSGQDLYSDAVVAAVFSWAYLAHRGSEIQDGSMYLGGALGFAFLAATSLSFDDKLRECHVAAARYREAHLDETVKVYLDPHDNCVHMIVSDPEL